MVGCGPRIRLERCGLVPQLLGKVLQLRQTGRQVSRRFGRSHSRRIPELHQRRQAYQTIRAVSLLRRELQHVGNRIGVSPFGRDEHPAQSADPRRERTAAGDDTLQRNALQTQRLPELRAQHASERQQAEPVLSGRRGDRKIRADRSQLRRAGQRPRRKGIPETETARRRHLAVQKIGRDVCPGH